ncbi:hypothetical protein C8J57DRAFT_1705287 [Mycena rebaudengoi]|nr:hypothetical protein C8J57DRAFT_1705287 [Mycena rebaudengoi]
MRLVELGVKTFSDGQTLSLSPAILRRTRVRRVSSHPRPRDALFNIADVEERALCEKLDYIADVETAAGGKIMLSDNNKAGAQVFMGRLCLPSLSLHTIEGVVIPAKAAVALHKPLPRIALLLPVIYFPPPLLQDARVLPPFLPDPHSIPPAHVLSILRSPRDHQSPPSARLDRPPPRPPRFLHVPPPPSHSISSHPFLHPPPPPTPPPSIFRPHRPRFPPSPRLFSYFCIFPVPLLVPRFPPHHLFSLTPGSCFFRLSAFLTLTTTSP